MYLQDLKNGDRFIKVQPRPFTSSVDITDTVNLYQKIKQVDSKLFGFNAIETRSGKLVIIEEDEQLVKVIL